MKTLKWIDRNFEPLCMAITFFLVCGLIFLQVVLRFIFKSGFAWGEEISRFLFVWSVFLSVPYITRNNKHVAVAALRDVLPDKVRKVLAILVDLSIIYFACTLFKSSIINVQYSMLYNDRATAVDISMNWLFMAPVVGYGLMILRAVQTLVWKIRHFGCSFPLFINQSGMYSESWDVVVAQGKYRDELRGASYDAAVAAEESAFRSSRRGGKKA